MAWLRRTSDLIWIASIVLWLGLTTSWHCRGCLHYWVSFRPPHYQALLHSSLSSSSPTLFLYPLYRNNSHPSFGNGLDPNPIQEQLLVHPSNVTEGAIDHDESPAREYGKSKEPEDHVYNNSELEYEPSKTCASVEEMGDTSVGNIVASSLKFRRIIEKYVSEHGAIHVRGLPAKEFCSRGFVYGRAGEDGLGNDMYRILTAAGLGIMLNRSIIIAEHGSTNPAYFGRTGHIRLPFGDYLKYSNQTFSLSELKWFWVKHDCAGKFRRPLIMRIDDFQKPTRTNVFCENWMTWKHPIVWFRGTTDSNALQFFLKNRHSTMRSLAISLFGDTRKPDSRPNVFGELFKAFISSMPVIDEAVRWALQNAPEPDLSVHLRMLNSRSKAPSYSMCNCIRRVVHNILGDGSSPQVVVVTDTPSIIRHIEEQLDGVAKVVHFNYLSYAESYHNLSNVMKMNYFQPPEKRIKDWGSMPRWVAIVDLFLASRAKNAVISGANRRVGTTYAQLLAALAAAMRIDDGQEDSAAFNFYSSFQPSLLVEGLEGQRGWGHTWRRFGGHLSCKNQTFQCARTPLLPYAWWDGQWQSPVPRDIQRMLAYGVKVSNTGEVDMHGLSKRCTERKAPIETVRLLLPSCKSLKLCS